MPKVTRHSFVIAVPDLPKSAAFYRDVLGFTVHTIPDPGWLFYRLGDCTIMAGECPNALPPSQLGDHAYFAYLEVEDIHALHDSVLAAGAQICKPLRDEPWHMREFGLAAWTTGSGCIAPHMVTGLLRAVKSGDSDAAQRLYDAFLPLETLRDDISLIRVLHDALTFSQLADMGPLLPLLSSTPSEHHAKIAEAARTLLALERDYARGAQSLNPST